MNKTLFKPKVQATTTEIPDTGCWYEKDMLLKSDCPKSVSAPGTAQMGNMGSLNQSHRLPKSEVTTPNQR